MFTIEPYQAELERLLQKPLVPCQYWSFDARDFSSEEAIRVARCRRTDFESILHFFINALRFTEAESVTPPADGASPDPHGETFTRFARAEKISPLSADEFYRFVAHHARCMKSPPILAVPGLDTFIDAVHLDAAWDEQCALAEFDRQYVMFYWSCSG